MCDDDIIEFFNKRNRKFRWDRLHNKYPEIYNYLINRFNDASSAKEAFIRLERKLYIRPSCKICVGYVDFCQRFAKFNETCCKECQTKLRWESIKNFNIEHYGVENFYASEQFKNQQIQNNLQKYGVKYHWQREDVKEKIKQTCLERYGCENGGASDQAQQKIRKTTFEHYGVEYSLSSPIVREKIKQTCLERYGCENGGASDQAQQKIHKTMLKNGTYNRKSKHEIYIFNLLKDYFPDVIWQYKDKHRYPFWCDFYIPSKDLFIEYNGYWMHNDHLFDKNNKNDLELLKEWETKSFERSSHYLSAIKTWTISDVNKYNVAKQNNLNYLIFYNLDEFDDWIINYDDI